MPRLSDPLARLSEHMAELPERPTSRAPPVSVTSLPDDDWPLALSTGMSAALPT